ncbi:hypothetical protein ACGFYZ_32055 [Streptomyces sp. NPDC048330]|uniref:hypothetical protein n=1 Tax=Streptomyces sp. NPDC048330 TaxID=3365533 RepID=UPI0037219AA0
MPLARTPRRRLAAAVTTVLAVTLGTGALSIPVYAVPAAGEDLTATAATAEADLPAYPQHDRLLDAGLTGFLTVDDAAGTSTWRRYADGAGQAYTGATFLRSTRTTDYLVFAGAYKVTQRNLRTNGSLEIPVGPAEGDAQYAGAAGDAVFTTLLTGAGTVLRKHTEAVTGLAVTGLPSNATELQVWPATPDHATVTFVQGSVDKWALLDLAAGTVDEIRDAAGSTAVSATRTAWAFNGSTSGPPQVFVADRATGAVQQIPVAQAPSLGPFHVGLVGDWVVYGEALGMDSSEPSAHYPLTAYHLTTGKTVRLLDHSYQLAPAPDGSLCVRGGLFGQGEGIYRIADTGADSPTVEKVATTGRPTELVITDVAVPPAALDPDRSNGFTFRWRLSRDVRNAVVTVRHVRTGKTQSFTAHWQRDVVFGWQNNTLATEDAPNGDYTWEIAAHPDNGIGPDAVSKGTFTVVRKAAPHDFNDNGSPDLLTRDSAGRMWRSDLLYRPAGDRNGLRRGEPKALLGAGWNIYDRIEAGGDLGGSAVGDLVARDKTGVLWLYPGNGAGSFGTRLRIGGGWQIYDKLTFGSDLTNDGRPDLLAIDKVGALWLHPGTGDAAKPLADRRKLGNGWGVYNDIVAVGDIAGAPAGDLLARDTSGVLWHYLGKGDGTFATRVKVGAGWNRFGNLVATGDADRDARPDLIGVTTAPYPDASLYKGTGDWRAPFRGAERTYVTELANPTDLVL